MSRAFVAAAAVLIATLHTPSTAADPKSVTIDGSSTVFPISEAIAEEFQKSTKGEVRVTVGISGTGGGFKKFCRGETDIANASRPISKEEIETCKAAGISFYELPIAFDALTVVVNPKNSNLQCITIADLKKIWEPGAQGKVTTWKGANDTWPDQPLKLFGPGADSGTFDYFTEAVNGKAKASRGDYTASEDDNVLVTGVSGDANALGYFGYAYYAADPGKMKALSIDWGKGEGCIAPTEETVIGGKYNPLSRPLLVYVSKKAAEKTEVRDYVTYALANAGELTKEVKYVPLPEEAYKMAKDRFDKGEVGSIFVGISAVGLHIEDMLKRKPVM